MDLPSRTFDLFARKVCVVCPSDVTPPCPSCSEGEQCQQIPQTCHKCEQRACVPISAPATQSTSSSDSGGANVGAIAGGIIGGIVFLAIVGYLFWRFFLKGRRQENAEYSWDEPDGQDEKGANDFAMRRDARASTHTVASMASTVLTRASNIIQIAYIPGVTNRSGPGSPQPLVPPVPPIPAVLSASGAEPQSLHSPNEDQHFFMPGDLRHSTQSGYSDFNRDSTISTVYRGNAVLSPQPAQPIVRGKAAVVSVKNSPLSPDGSPTTTPNEGNTLVSPRPTFEHKHSSDSKNSSHSGARIQSPGGSIRSTAQIGRPVPLNITKKKPSNASMASGNVATPTTATTLVSEPDAGATGATNPAIHAALAAAASTRPLTNGSPNSAYSPTQPSNSSDRAKSPRQQLRLFPPTASPLSYTSTESEDEQEAQSPFNDSNSQQRRQIEEAVRRASRTVQGRNRSPFGDENAVDAKNRR